MCQGYPSKRVKGSSGLQANFTGKVTLSPGSTLPALLTCFVMRDSLCNGPKFEENTKTQKNTLNSQKKGKYYHHRQNTPFYFPNVYNYCAFRKHTNSEVQKQDSLLVIVIMIDSSEKRNCEGGF